ncbi:hypothetical protein TH66_00270 [Carbonactinospora thermoautotrophica]|uniref:Pycsar effector protein domain-containing protein n=1 Tax=Carbonactinospora thermoautotrophica TaxID=1469144 RepID=A0A132NIE5_9ACTN|nr:Pycsar system effector family protein [Carbonactinospora thermoautotrophica]KWX05985.1 hypothetical protein TH66_00270 [Carbonactinospora thermoautotrophica]KWX09848.1 hypothetical protein TR74_07165 [Carbonactinospora thermoautotrophica]
MTVPEIPTANGTAAAVDEPRALARFATRGGGVVTVYLVRRQLPDYEHHMESAYWRCDCGNGSDLEPLWRAKRLAHEHAEDCRAIPADLDTPPATYAAGMLGDIHDRLGETVRDLWGINQGVGALVEAVKGDPEERVCERLVRQIDETRVETRNADAKAGLLLALAGLTVTNPDKLPGGAFAAVGHALAYAAILLLLWAVLPRLGPRRRPFGARTDFPGWARRATAGDVEFDVRAGFDSPLTLAERLHTLARVAVRKYRLIQAAVVLLAAAAGLYGLAGLTH